jgi:hypothetical protein
MRITVRWNSDSVEFALNFLLENGGADLSAPITPLEMVIIP